MSSGNFLPETRLLKPTEIEKQMGQTKVVATLTDEIEMVRDVTRQDHLDDDGSHVPVLSFAEELKDVVLWVQKQLESYGAVVVLKHRLVIVTDRLSVLHRDQERVVHATGNMKSLDMAKKVVTYGCWMSQRRHAKKADIMLRSLNVFMSSPYLTK